MRRLLLIAVVCSLAGCEATVATGLAESEANDVVVALHGQGIGAAKEAMESGDGFRVIVSPDEVAPALEVMRAEALPRETEPGLGEVFGEGGLVPTATEERARYVAALGGELSQSIEAMSGVLEARVHVALPDQRRVALDDARPTPRASVLIRYRGTRPPYDEAAVRSLVSGAVQELAPEQVAVVGVAAGPAPERREANLVRVGPMTVTRGSSVTLKAILGGAFGLNVVLAAALVWVWRRRRTTVQATAE